MFPSKFYFESRSGQCILHAMLTMVTWPQSTARAKLMLQGHYDMLVWQENWLNCCFWWAAKCCKLLNSPFKTCLLAHFIPSRPGNLIYLSWWWLTLHSTYRWSQEGPVQVGWNLNLGLFLTLAEEMHKADTLWKGLIFSSGFYHIFDFWKRTCCWVQWPTGSYNSSKTSSWQTGSALSAFLSF